MKIVCISDTHRDYHKLEIPEADVLIHAGDIDVYEFSSELKDFNRWLATVPCKHKIIVAGNHDGFIDKTSIYHAKDLLTNGIYLESESLIIDGVKFWGSPVTPIFNNWYFMMEGDSRRELWDTIPNDTDILITHGPPNEILDYVEIGYNHHVGCVHLRNRVEKLKPKFHIFGHIHGSYGMVKKEWMKVNEFKQTTHFINASVMDEGYNVVNKPVEVFYYKETGDVVF